MEVLDQNNISQPLQKQKTDPVDSLMKNGEVFLAKSLLAARVQAYPQNSQDLFKLAEVFLKRKEFESAEKTLREIIRIEDSARGWAGLGDLYYTLERYDEAREAYLDAILRADDNRVLLFESYKNIGNIFVRYAEYDIAEDFYNRAFTINPTSDVLAVNFGTLSLQNQDYGKAVLKFRDALRINPNNDKAWVGLALAHDNCGDKDLALANLKNALEKDPFNRTALLINAQWCLRDSRFFEGIPLLISYLDDNDFDLQLSQALVELLLRSGNELMASFEIERGLCWEPKDEVLLRFEAELKAARKQ